MFYICTIVYNNLKADLFRIYGKDTGRGNQNKQNVGTGISLSVVYITKHSTG